MTAAVSQPPTAAATIGRADGLTKLVADAESGRVLGVGVVGGDPALLAGDPQARACAAPDVRPGPKQNLQALACFLAAGENDLLLAVMCVCRRGNEHAVGDDLVFAWKPRGGGVARMRRDGDPVVEPFREESPERRATLHPAELAVRVERADHRPAPERDRGDRDRRRHRLMDVQHVEALTRERAPDAGDRSR